MGEHCEPGKAEPTVACTIDETFAGIRGAIVKRRFGESLAPFLADTFLFQRTSGTVNCFMIFVNEDFLFADSSRARWDRIKIVGERGKTGQLGNVGHRAKS